MKFSLFCLSASLLLLALPRPAAAEIVEETVEYALPDGTAAMGVAIYDDERDREGGGRPGVLVIPEWWGLTDYPKMRARELAEQGYVTFVADMYGEGQTTDDPQQAGQWAGAANEAGLAELAKPALEELAKLPGVDADNLAAIGFCFGGNTVVHMAKSDYGSRLKAVVSFHGGLAPEAAPEVEGYDGPAMLILHGGADPMDTPEQFGGFVQRCIAAGVPVSTVSFPGALHAFSNPAADALAEKNPSMQGAIAYDEQAAEISLEVMEEFFEMVFDYDDDHDEDDDQDDD